MNESLRSRIIDILHGWNHLQLHQFSVDWIQEFEEEFPIKVKDRAIAYRLDIIREVLATGKDKDFFEMLHTFSRLYIGDK